VHTTVPTTVQTNGAPTLRVGRVGRGNVRHGRIRLRRGTAAGAWRRLHHTPPDRRASTSGVDGLVSVPLPDPPAVVLVAGAVSRVDPDRLRIELGADQGRYDLAFAYAHELGHLFDHLLLDDAHRAEFGEAVGTGRPWTGDRYTRNVEEAWASAFAVLACAGPWRCDLWAPANWPEERTPLVIASCAELVRRVSGVAPLTAPRTSRPRGRRRAR
jgi:hypothetical protein